MLSTTPVTSLSEFVREVQEIRKSWAVPGHKELWFRGESKKYEKTLLRPNIYRPRKDHDLEPIDKILDMENDLYEKFMDHAGLFSDEKPDPKDANWDWYFLMQHHRAPNRLLDWTDGALMALHFAVRDKTKDSNVKDDSDNPCVYVLEPDRMQDYLKTLPEIGIVQQQWKEYLKKHDDLKFEGLTDEDWEEAYLPDDEEERKELPLPRVPLLLNFPRISRRVAAQRSQFMVFGTDPSWLAEEFTRPDATIKEISIDVNAAYDLRTELRGSGITESVIFPDLDGLGRELDQVWRDWRNSI